MAAMIRIAMFNCENLFSRPKLLNYSNNDTARPALNKVAELDKILAQAV